MLKLLEQHQPELFFGELRVDKRQRDGMKRQVPCREPGILPFVWHREHPHGVQVTPVPVSDRRAGSGGGSGVVALQPSGHIEKVNLLRPEQTRKRLPLNQPLVFARFGWINRFVEFIRFGAALPNDTYRNRAHGFVRGFRRKPSCRTTEAPARNFVAIIEAGLRADARRVDGRYARCSRCAVKSILQKRTSIRHAVQPLLIRFIVREQGEPPGSTVQIAFPKPVGEGKIRPTAAAVLSSATRQTASSVAEPT